MSFSEENGYVPVSIDTIMLAIMNNVNTQFGTSYTTETFLGTNFYKFYYAMAQRLQENEVKTSEIFVYLQQYFAITNERIQRPVATNPGLIEALEREGFIASVKKTIEADAGKAYICVDVLDDHARGKVTISSYANLVSGTDDVITVGATAFTAQAGAATPGDATFQAATSNAATAASLAAQINAHATAGAVVTAEVDEAGTAVIIRAIARGTGGNSVVLTYTDNDTNVGATVTGSGTLLGGIAQDDDYDDLKLEIATIIKNSVAAGIVTKGDELEAITLSNGQSFDFRFALPRRYEPLLKLTLTTSENNQVVIDSPEDVKELLMENIAARYRLGKNFEPQRYFERSDAPWTAHVLLEWSTDAGGTWHDEPFDSEFDQIYDILLENIEVVEA